MDFEKNLRADLAKYLTGLGYVDQHLPECPDVEELWPAIGEAYLPDGIREFAKYPVSSLGWIMFVGMALAHFWDTDWERYAKLTGAEIYEALRDSEGYDNMDEFILSAVLGLDAARAEAYSKLVGECASRVDHALRTSGAEPGTADAMRAYVSALHALYDMGVAVELRRLGYRMTPLG